MPEGDTVWRTASRLNQVFAGRRLTECDLRWPGLSTLDLTGAETLEVVPRGKHLLHRLDSGWTIHSHLRMDGSWRIEKVDASSRPPASPILRAVLATADVRALGWRLGMLDVVRSRDEHTLVGHLGPDLLSPTFDADRAIANLNASDATLAAALLDQTNLAGLGTMWAAEVLFARRLDPFAAASAFGAATLTGLVTKARQMLRASCDQAVPSRAGFDAGRHSTYVHGRRHKPCRRCGTLIRMEFSSGRRRSNARCTSAHAARARRGPAAARPQTRSRAFPGQMRSTRGEHQQVHVPDPDAQTPIEPV
jgi:endonuclease VIII